MARVVVTYAAFVEGQFPPVCCKTGVRADKYIRWRFAQTPGWTWILLPFAVIPFLIARSLTTKDYEGVLPISFRQERRIRLVARATLVLGILGVVMLVAGIAAPAWAVAGLITLAVAALFLGLGFVWTPGAYRDVGEGTVELSRMHPAFVSALYAAAEQPPLSL